MIPKKKLEQSLKKTPHTVDYKILNRRCKDSITQHWIKELTTSQLATMLYLMDRTLRFDKLSEIILRKHVHKPIVSRSTGEVVNQGLPFTYKTYTRNLKVLKDLGLVSTSIEVNNRGRSQRVHMEVKRILEKPMSHLKLPKNTKKTKTGGRDKYVPMGRDKNVPPEVKDIEVRDNKSDERPSQRLQTIHKTAENAKKLSTEHKNKKAQNWKTYSGFRALWDVSTEKVTGETNVSVITNKDWGIWKKRLIRYKGKNIQLPELMEWSIENWYQLSRTSMAWAVEKNLMGSTPSGTSFCMLFNKFYQLWLDKETEGTQIVISQKPVKQKTAKSVNNSVEDRLGNMKLISGGKQAKTVSHSRNRNEDNDWEPLGDIDVDLPEWRDE